MNTSFKDAIVSGVIAGVIWGWSAMVVNSISGAFPFEHTFIYNLIIFSISGAIFGVIVAGFLTLIGRLLPFKKIMPKAILISTSFWLLLRSGGVALSIMMPDRYYPEIPQAVQGFFLSILLGVLLSLLWKDKEAKIPANHLFQNGME